MQYVQNLKQLILKHKILSGVAALILIFVLYKWYQGAHAAAGKVSYLTAAAAPTTIVSSINATGQVSAQNKIDLKPGGSGSVAVALTSVNVKQGDQVKAGQIIATADEKNNNVALIQARAALASAQANYDKLVAGATSIDLQTSQLAVDSAQQNLDKAKRDYDTTVTTQQQNVDKAYSTLLNADLQALPNDAATTAPVTLSGNYSGKTPGRYTISVYSAGDGFHYQTTGLGNSGSLINRGVAQPLGNGLYITFGTSGTISATTTWTIDLPNLESSNYINNNFAYTTAQQNQANAVQTAQDNITAAQNALKSAQLAQQSKTVPPSNADLASATAQIAQAQAQLATAEVNYNNNIIKSPFDGQVAQLNNQAGDQVTSSTVIATIITNQKLAVVSLNEVDASKIKTGQKANVTFDAIDGLSLVGTVAEIDTLGTVSQGVVTYTAKIGFDSQDDRIKPGMSAAAAIILDEKADVLAVPNSAVKTDSTGGSYVQILDAAGKPQNHPVQAGISDDTNTEITSGLTAGDLVVTQTITATATTTATARPGTGSLIPGLGGARVFNGGAGRGN